MCVFTFSSSACAFVEMNLSFKSFSLGFKEVLGPTNLHGKIQKHVFSEHEKTTVSASREPYVPYVRSMYVHFESSKKSVECYGVDKIRGLINHTSPKDQKTTFRMVE